MNRILLGKGEEPVYLHAKYGTRHGLVAGATGTGKTVSLMVIAEGFSRMGVPVFMADVKGDVAGLAMPGKGGDKILARVDAIGIDGDRKSTRLNSSHSQISYAVFCLKKKKTAASTT